MSPATEADTTDHQVSERSIFANLFQLSCLNDLLGHISIFNVFLFVPHNYLYYNDKTHSTAARKLNSAFVY